MTSELQKVRDTMMEGCNELSSDSSAENKPKILANFSRTVGRAQELDKLNRKCEAMIESMVEAVSSQVPSLGDGEEVATRHSRLPKALGIVTQETKRSL